VKLAKLTWPLYACDRMPGAKTQHSPSSGDSRGEARRARRLRVEVFAGLGCRPEQTQMVQLARAKPVPDLVLAGPSGAA
jgi:hypothetical protein